ncbi:MAG: cation:proton antiporter [Leptospiraceae bacterium]|nr:cation:proton antiporter [Leptospiraceae bacterium]
MHGLLTDIGIAIVIATATTLIIHFLKQPMILGYLIAGVIIGPYITPQLVADVHNIKVISEMGLILLLFIIGLELNPQTLIANGQTILITGLGQFPLNIILTLGFFQLFATLFGGAKLEILYLAFFCSLSSTAIVVKSLYDKFELDSIPGRITVGILIFQDIWAILLLVLQPNFNDPQISLILIAIAKAILLLISGFVISKYLLSSLFSRISKSPELVVSVSIGWCAAVAGSASLLGLSMEMGALIAGISISTFPYHIHITAKISPLRDFFMTLFFISLGMKIPAPQAEFFSPLVVIILAAVLSKLLVIYPLVRLAGNSHRSALLSSMNLTQISEFSPVIATLGLKYGHISETTFSLLLYGLGITAVTSTYTIKYNLQIYNFIQNILNRLRKKPSIHGLRDTENAEVENDYPIVILGFHRGARAFIDEIKIINPTLLEKIMVVDYNLEVLKELSNFGMKGIFGDIGSSDTLTHALIHDAAMIISTVPDLLLKGTSNLKLTKVCRELSPDAVIYATAEMPEQIPALEQAGANFVILPYSLAGKTLAREIAVISRDELASI